MAQQLKLEALQEQLALELLVLALLEQAEQPDMDLIHHLDIKDQEINDLCLIE